MHDNKSSPHHNSSVTVNTSIQCELVGERQICQGELEPFFLLSIDLLCIAGFDGYFKCLNPAWSKTLGYSDAELLAKPYLEFVHPEDIPATIAEAKKLKTGGQTIEFHNRYRCQDGSYRRLSWNITAVPEKQVFYCIARDITPNKQQEAELRHSQQQLHQSLEHLSNLKYALDCSAIVAITDHQGIITEVNDRFCQLSQYSREELLGKDHRLINSGYHPPSFFRDLWSTITSGKVWHGEIKNRAKDGSFYWVDTTIVPFLDNCGQPWQYLAIRFDITERKAAEKILKKQALIFERISEGIIITNLEGRIIDWNSAAEKMFGYTFSEVVGKTPAILHRPEEAAKLTQQIIEGIKRDNIWSGEIIFVRPDGTEGISETVVVPLEDNSGQMVATIGINRDITKKKQREEALKQQAEIINQIHDAVVTTDRDGYITSWNQGAERLFGYQTQAIVGQHIRILYLEDQQTYLQQQIVEPLLQQEAHELEVTMLKQSGETFAAHLSLSLQKDNDGKVIGMIGYFMDISDRKRAEAAEHQLKIALENAVEGVAFLDPQGHYLEVNQAYANITGYQSEEMMGMNWQVTVFPEDRDRLLIAYQQMLQDGKVEVEARGVRQDGSLFFKAVVMITAYNEKQEFIGHYCFVKDITHRRQREERLHLLESVVVNANDVILIAEAEPIDEPGPRIIYVNPAFTKMTGYTFEEVRDKSPRILQGERSQRSELDKIRHALENWQSVRVELINYRKDGSEFWVEINITPVADRRGWYTHWIAIQRDITERKLAEEQLRLQMRRAQLFADISLKIRQSLQLEDILKTTTNELQKLLDADRVLILRLEKPTTLQVVQETCKTEWDSVLRKGFVNDCLDEEYFFQYPQGRLYSISNVNEAEVPECLIDFLHQFQVKSKLVIPLLLRENLWGMIVVHQCSRPRNWTDWEIDILKQIANQIAIALGQSYLVQELSSSKQRWATLADTTPVGIFLTDSDGNCNYINHFWSKIAGMTMAEASGRGWSSAIHPEDRDRVFSEWYQAVENNLPFASEYRFIHPDGKITWVYGQAIAETTTDGKVTGYIGTLTDITERLQIEKIQRALEREKKMSELKLRFFSMASHEFRTPLSIITFATQVLENSEPEWLDQKKIRNINRIKDSARKITQMLTDVLTLARAEAEKLELKPTTINLELFCQQIVEEVKTTRTENSAISFVNKGNRHNEVYLDDKLLHSILINLLSNAVKYSPPGEEITFEVDLQSEAVVFSVKDRGIGISLSDQAHLFEAFHRGENVGRIDGTGLGLAIVKRCVDLQRGTIDCNSHPNRGTTFIVSLPLTDSELRSQT